MGIAYTIIENSKRSHPFREGSAGRALFEGFMRRRPKLTIRSPQPLSYCRALVQTRIWYRISLASFAQFMEG